MTTKQKAQLISRLDEVFGFAFEQLDGTAKGREFHDMALEVMEMLGEIESC